MFAIIQTGGKQYKVRKKDKIRIEKLAKKEGQKVIFDKVLLVAREGKKTPKVKIGTPFIKNAKCEGKVLEQTKEDKVIIFKFKPKSNYKKKKGHRQPKTVVQITDIKA